MFGSGSWCVCVLTKLENKNKIFRLCNYLYMSNMPTFNVSVFSSFFFFFLFFYC